VIAAHLADVQMLEMADPTTPTNGCPSDKRDLGACSRSLHTARCVAAAYWVSSVAPCLKSRQARRRAAAPGRCGTAEGPVLGCANFLRQVPQTGFTAIAFRDGGRTMPRTRGFLVCGRTMIFGATAIIGESFATPADFIDSITHPTISPSR
jgi:hypothetical protein